MGLAGTDRSTADVQVTFALAPTETAPGESRGGVGEIRIVQHTTTRRKDPRIKVCAFLGPLEKITLDTVRQAGGHTVRWLISHDVRSADVDVAELEKLKVDGAVGALCEGLALGEFRFVRHKVDAKDKRSPSISLLPGSDKGKAAIRRAARRASVITDGVNLAREWAHEPPNVINPVTLASRVRRMARASGLKCTVFDEKRLAQMKANALLSVGLASKTPSRLIVVEYAGTAAGRKRKPVVLIGKAITFDTGGYSIKDKEGIVGMKYDKCGGMAVIGVLRAAAAAGIKSPVVGILAAAENMISGTAYRPNDIIKTMSGKTVEIVSTDAEGRLVLADALTYAQRRCKPRAIIDVATLTGGIIVALGAVRAGLFANDDALADKLIASGERVHERLWRMPLDDEYLEPLVGEDSDLKNSAGRKAHPILGAIFLKQFVEDDVPWAHIDIGGVADTDKDLAYCPKGATGFGVRLLFDYLENL